MFLKKDPLGPGRPAEEEEGEKEGFRMVIISGAKIYNLQEVVSLIGICDRVLKEDIEKGNLRAAKRGGRFWISEEAIFEYLTKPTKPTKYKRRRKAEGSEASEGSAGLADERAAGDGEQVEAASDGPRAEE